MIMIITKTGECNGPVGTGRFWFRMYQVTGDRTWLLWAQASAKTIVDHAGTFYTILIISDPILIVGFSGYV
jgi:hypothetical protein